MNTQAEDKAAAAPAGDGRTDKDKINDIGLSDEELAALGTEDDEAAADEAGDTGKDAGEAAAKEATDAKGQSQAEKEAAAADAGEATDATPEKVPDQFVAMAETLSEEDLKQIDDNLSDIKKQFDDGDIDYEEYTDERLKLEKQVWHHEQAVMTNENAIDQRWKWERDWYLQSNAELNNSQVIYGAFASQVNALLADDEFSTAAGFEILSEAHRRVAAEIASLAGPGSAAPPTGQPAGAKLSADKRAANALKAAKAAESGKRPAATLAGVPAAEANVDQSKWSALDNLDGEALQKAIDKLSPADLKEYEDHHE